MDNINRIFFISPAPRKRIFPGLVLVKFESRGKKMKKNWNQILESAQPVVDFLSSDSFFSRPYDGDRERFIVTASPTNLLVTQHQMLEHVKTAK